MSEEKKEEKKEKEIKRKKKKSDVFSLFKREKIIRFESNDEYIEILMVKMKQSERKSVLDFYFEKLSKFQIDFKQREDKTNRNLNSIVNFSKDDVIKGIVEFERADRFRVVDLIPKFDEMKEAEKEKAIEKELKEWQQKRKENFSKKEDAELRKIFIDKLIESQALMEATTCLNYATLAKMCLDLKTQEPIFKSPEEVLEIIDKRIFEWLLEELNEFRRLESEEDIRRVSSGGDFLESGQSQNA